MTVFVDTAALYAFLDANDANHAECQREWAMAILSQRYAHARGWVSSLRCVLRSSQPCLFAFIPNRKRVTAMRLTPTSYSTNVAR
jgi:hypothetical protein